MEHIKSYFTKQMKRLELQIEKRTFDPAVHEQLEVEPPKSPRISEMDKSESQPIGSDDEEEVKKETVHVNNNRRPVEDSG